MQGRSDGLGDRLLMSDNSGTPSLELLRFRPEFAGTYGFETALRERVERLRRFEHPAFPHVRAVEYLDDGDGLALVSTYTPGARLSDMFRDAKLRAGMHPIFATWLIRELTAAIAELQEQGINVAHGALSPDRIVLTPERRVLVTEHVLGSALERLALPSNRLWSDVGIVGLPNDSGSPLLDSRADVIQIGLVGLSVLLGRHLTPADYPQHLESLLDELSDTVGRRIPALIGPLREWLERALRVDGSGFRSARDARDGITALPGGFERPAIDDASSRHPPGATSDQRPQDPAASKTAFVRSMPRAARHESGRPPTPVRPVTETSFGLRLSRRQDGNGMRTVAIVLAVLAVVEAAVIAGLLYNPAGSATPASVPIIVESRQPGDLVVVDGRQLGVTPMGVAVGAETHTIRIVQQEPVSSDSLDAAAAVVPASISNTDLKANNALEQAAARQRSGGLRIVSPIEVQVFEGDRVLGSSADGPIVATAGIHELDLVNNALGYRSRQSFEIKAGQIISRRVTPPNGTISVNALPWAQVWIDGNPVGETPLANLSVPVGEHEVLFRHPQLGERREKAIVKSAALTRVSATLAR
jgi:hypothetical protein